MKVNLTEARIKLSQLMREVEDGQSVTICRRGVAIVDLIPSKERIAERPKFGTRKGKVVVHDPDWWKPMTEEELKDFMDGRS